MAALAFCVMVWLSTFPPPQAGEDEAAAAGEVQFAAVREIVELRCALCHAAEPAWEGMAGAPKGVRLESEAEIHRQAREIYLQAARSHAMPPGNITDISLEERRQLAAWFETGGG